MNGFLEAIGALMPPVGVGIFFFVAIRAMIQADRRERLARAREEAEQDAARTPPGDGGGTI